jgi:hypothetical protein
VVCTQAPGIPLLTLDGAPPQVEVFFASEATVRALQAAMVQPAYSVFNSSYFKLPLRLGFGSGATSMVEEGRGFSRGTSSPTPEPLASLPSRVASPVAAPMQFQAVTDRGPNVECSNPNNGGSDAEEGVLRCPFSLPSEAARVFLQVGYVPSIVTVTLHANLSFDVAPRPLLLRPLSGVPTPPLNSTAGTGN